MLETTAPPTEKHFKVTVFFMKVVRSSAEGQSPAFYVTESGLLHSMRAAHDGFVRIGRQQLTEQGERPNDITLPSNDRAISRSHCMIAYSPFFTRTVPAGWTAFFMAAHPRLGQNSVFQHLPCELLRYIISFIKEPFVPYVLDTGSMCGTYVKVSSVEGVALVEGQKFLVGSDIIIEIEKVLGSSCESPVEEEVTVQEVLETEPSVVFKISRYPNDHEETVHPTSWKFTAEGEYKKFSIGRSQTCDIHLAENTISRTQCRVAFERSKWTLLDGLEDKPTINGTWLCISRTDNLAREDSEPYPLSNGTQIKISDTVLQIEWVNNT